MKNWLKKHDACDDGYKWAVTSCKTMDDVWRTAKPEWLIWVATRPGTLADRQLWLFACWCAEQAVTYWVAKYPDDTRPQDAIACRRRWLDGAATDDELAAASNAARAAARAAAWDAARDAAWDAARTAASNAASYAARTAASYAARAARDAQSQWLRDNCTPNFGEDA